MWVSIRLGQYFDLRQNSSENFFVLISSALGIVLITSLIYKQSKSFWD
jgi:hypothetical protein